MQTLLQGAFCTIATLPGAFLGRRSQIAVQGGGAAIAGSAVQAWGAFDDESGHCDDSACRTSIEPGRGPDFPDVRGIRSGNRPARHVCGIRHVCAEARVVPDTGRRLGAILIARSR